MPELPEVEVVKRSLQKKILNLIIKKVEINDCKLRYKVKYDQISKLVGKRVKKISRRSKYLIFEFESEIFMMVHLGMTGKFFFINKNNKKFKTSFYYYLNKEKDNNYNRVIFFFKTNQKLIYNDVRKFGFIKVYKKQQFYKNQHLKNLGPEPLNKNCNFAYFKKYIHRRNRTIKDILMDQKFISGLGNIYVNEVLFLSGVKPSRKVSRLRDHEIYKILKNIKKVLKISIKLGGASIKDFSNDDGKQGFFQQYFKVYGRKNEICSNADCNNKILKTIISNRSTFFCNNCQK